MFVFANDREEREISPPLPRFSCQTGTLKIFESFSFESKKKKSVIFCIAVVVVVVVVVVVEAA
jgi:hypothetical protein